MGRRHDLRDRAGRVEQIALGHWHTYPLEVPRDLSKVPRDVARIVAAEVGDPESRSRLLHRTALPTRPSARAIAGATSRPWRGAAHHTSTIEIMALARLSTNAG